MKSFYIWMSLALTIIGVMIGIVIQIGISHETTTVNKNTWKDMPQEIQFMYDQMSQGGKRYLSIEELNILLNAHNAVIERQQDQDRSKFLRDNYNGETE